MKTTFKSKEPKKSIYRDYSNFCFECFKYGLMYRICQEKHIYSDFKSKTFRSNQKPNTNKTLREAIVKRS